MATVYLARLSGAGGFQRFVAIKRLHPHLAGDTDFIEMFLDEARLAARLHHPNVVPIVEIGESPDGYYLVMEYIEGDTLARLIARSAKSAFALPLRAGVRILLDTLAGLDAAHELNGDDGLPLNIVHRDVSPQNILIGLDGSARITDFGVARAATRLSTTRTGQLKGKLAYMAPEQARGSEVDRRADLFAVGIVLWETLAQRRLFRGDAEAETLNRLLYEPIPLLRSANPDAPAGLEAVCAKALQRDPADRFQTCAEFADALEAEARAANLLGSHKEVAAHLSAVMGTDISQQRDAMRAWLARSEPNRLRDPRLVSGANPAAKQSDSAPPRRITSNSQPSRPSGTSGLSGAEAAALSVSSAGDPPTPSRGVTRLIAAALAAGLVVAGVLFFTLRSSGARTASTPVSATATATPTATATGFAPSTPTASVAVASSSKPDVSVPAAASGSAVSPVATKSRLPGLRPTVSSATALPLAKPVASAPGVVDDMAVNPYR